MVHCGSHFRGFLLRNGILPGAIFTLRPSLAFSYIGSVTARHLLNSIQKRSPPIFGGRVSRWASSHILVLSFSAVYKNQIKCSSECGPLNLRRPVVSNCVNFPKSVPAPADPVLHEYLSVSISVSLSSIQATVLLARRKLARAY